VLQKELRDLQKLTNFAAQRLKEAEQTGVELQKEQLGFQQRELSKSPVKIRRAYSSLGDTL